MRAYASCFDLPSLAFRYIKMRNFFKRTTLFFVYSETYRLDHLVLRLCIRTTGMVQIEAASDPGSIMKYLSVYNSLARQLASPPCFGWPASPSFKSPVVTYVCNIVDRH
ncbi:unnamed protein product [Urochloa humidicola]